MALRLLMAQPAGRESDNDDDDSGEGIPVCPLHGHLGKALQQTLLNQQQQSCHRMAPTSALFVTNSDVNDAEVLLSSASPPNATAGDLSNNNSSTLSDSTNASSNEPLITTTFNQPAVLQLRRPITTLHYGPWLAQTSNEADQYSTTLNQQQSAFYGEVANRPLKSILKNKEMKRLRLIKLLYGINL